MHCQKVGSAGILNVQGEHRIVCICSGFAPFFCVVFYVLCDTFLCAQLRHSGVVDTRAVNMPPAPMTLPVALRKIMTMYILLVWGQFGKRYI